MRKTAPVVLVLLAAGCSLFQSRPMPPPRPAHVIIVGMDSVKQTDIGPARTPHLYRMQRDGAYTWELQAAESASRLSTYAEALTGLPLSLHPSRAALRRSSLFSLCRSAMRPALCVARTAELAALDDAAVRVSGLSAELNDAESVGAYAASEFMRLRPASLFVELSLGVDTAESCDAGLGHLVAAVQQLSLGEQVTIIALSAKPPALWWLVRGPGTRHGHRLAERVSAADTFTTALRLLSLSAPEPRGRVVAGAFRAWSREPKSEGERTIERGSVHGRVLRPDGGPMPRASVLLVKDEPPDGIRERWADADAAGDFRFDSIPAVTYDYVFVFDNVRRRLRHSLLVASAFEVVRDTTIQQTLWYRRLRGSDRNAPVAAPADTAAAFLTDAQVRTLADYCHGRAAVWHSSRDRTEPPALVADALSGSRAHTSLVRQWLLAAAEKARQEAQNAAATAALLDGVTDLAAVYDLSRATGLLTDTEERDVQIVLASAADLIVRAYHRQALGTEANACVPLALTAGALRSWRLARNWIDAADDMFEKRLAALAALAEAEPGAVRHEELCSVIEYAMINHALGCGNYLRARLERLVWLAAACLRPSERRCSPTARTAEPPAALGFLGLARSAFADRELGPEMHALWVMCGSPCWAPRGSESVLGPLLTAGAAVEPAQPRAVASRHLTGTTAVLSDKWGTPVEWFVYVNGWALEVHVQAAKLAVMRTAPLAGLAESRTEITRFISSPAYDYVLLSGCISRGAEPSATAFRHVLLNKLSGYVVVADEFPKRVVSSTIIQAAGATRGTVLVGDEGVEAQVLALAADLDGAGPSIRVRSASDRPIIAICPPPAGAQAAGAALAEWDVTGVSLAEDRRATADGAHVLLTTDRGREFIYLSRLPAHVEGNTENDILEGRVALIRRGTQSVDLVLVDAQWAQADALFFGLERGHGYATVHAAGHAEGWSQGRSRELRLSLGDKAPRAPTLTVDGVPRRLWMTAGRAVFGLRSGPHTFLLR